MSDLDLDHRDTDGSKGTDRTTLTAADLTRRHLLRSVGAATLGVAAVGTIAACSSSGGSGGGSGSGSATTKAASTDGVLAKLADIPVGGAISATGADGKEIILSQPTAGTVVGLSAICTHQGCTVAPDGDTGELLCPCHGSVYKAADGSNVSGPAPKPLAAVKVHVADGEVVAG